MLIAFWLVALPSMLAGLVDVLAPLRLDELGASGLAVGAVFLIAAAIEATVSPSIGRFSDRRGRLLPIRVGLLVAASSPPCCRCRRASSSSARSWSVFLAMSLIWTPAMALLSDDAEAAGLDLAFATALVSLAWAGARCSAARRSSRSPTRPATRSPTRSSPRCSRSRSPPWPARCRAARVSERARQRVGAAAWRRVGEEECRCRRRTAAEGDGESPLARAITPKLLLLFIVGDILGGGIYALVGEVGAETGGAIWSAFMLALVMAAFTAGSYAELVSKYPHAGGAALYVHRAFKNRSSPSSSPSP